MSIRRKLFISALTMLLVPAVLIGLLSALFLGVSAIIDPSTLLPLYGGFSALGGEITKIVIIWAVLAIIIIITVGLCIASYLSRTILTPLKRLADAIEHMKNGELDFEFAGSGDEEIQAICLSLEELRLKLQRDVRRSLKKESEQKLLLANISHDIKTPITSIKGYIEGIRDGVADTDEKKRRYLDTVYIKAETIEQMAENLSIYSKLELGRVQYNRSLTDIIEFVRTVLSEFSIDLQSADMDFSLDLPNASCTALLDRENIRRVFSNIITNAIKYKLSGRGSLSVTGELTENGFLLTFKDLGRGISEEDLAHIFEGFYRGDKSRNSNIEGNGLGLSICRRIIHDHGGKIWLRSPNGIGCEVSILFPIRGTQNENSDN